MASLWRLLDLADFYYASEGSSTAAKDPHFGSAGFGCTGGILSDPPVTCRCESEHSFAQPQVPVDLFLSMAHWPGSLAGNGGYLGRC